MARSRRPIWRNR